LILAADVSQREGRERERERVVKRERERERDLVTRPKREPRPRITKGRHAICTHETKNSIPLLNKVTLLFA
jgi:hypothetical protein